MNRILLVGILIYGLILLGLATLNSALLALALPLIVYLATGLIFSPDQINLDINRSITPERVTQDTHVEVVINICNKGRHLEEVYFQDLCPTKLKIVSGAHDLLTELPQGETIEIRYTVQGKRGIYHFDGVQVTAHDRLGLFRRRQFFPIDGQIFILPIVPRLKKVAIRPRLTRVYSGIVPARIGGSGVEFFGVREYQPGDRIRSINWKASARNSETLFSNEFEQERVADVGLILDARLRCDIQAPSGALFEHQVTATAALAEALLNDGNRVSLLVYGGFLDWTYPGYGKVQRERILQALARARTGASMVFENLENLPTRVFPPKSQIILISPLLNEDLPFLIHIRARGYPLIIISPDPIKFQEEHLGGKQNTLLAVRLARLERGLLFRKLRHSGINVLNWDVTMRFDQAMHTALSRSMLYAHPLMGGR